MSAWLKKKKAMGKKFLDDLTPSRTWTFRIQRQKRDNGDGCTPHAIRSLLSYFVPWMNENRMRPKLLVQGQLV
jgi:hypothetical protein